ncbi:hypothetical protein HFN63_36490 [Rhizobium leguminosarum]|uniref:hypothetical protein n=1 Tax=Rhizobium leguminosarum TaxID=384 RepID=UPI001C960420|nr:hypothetical protein [Rhizobium leguminosarum]MBY5775425.1 hypothetical protein [Rhizobium leguminosarum]
MVDVVMREAGWRATVSPAIDDALAKEKRAEVMNDEIGLERAGLAMRGAEGSRIGQ